MIEFKNNHFVVCRLSDGTIIHKRKTSENIEDLIVSQDNILALSLKYNNGLLFYDCKNLELLKKLKVHGISLALEQNAVFAVDDDHLYRYNLANQDQVDYEKFINSIQKDKISVDDKLYYTLIQKLKNFPEIITKTGVVENFLKQKKLSIKYYFKYSKINSKGNKMLVDNSIDNLYGYKIYYEVQNNSENYYFMRLNIAWDDDYWGCDSFKGVRHLTLHHDDGLIAPGNIFRGKFEVGEKEPRQLLIYPVLLRKISKDYYQRIVGF